ncbi:hypothetical protein [Stakelama saccharophila]|uniref:Uncharacterized protein n=1 Tax=Stakelama saccharophila TaxID=3075605 RepID=A0ABZ0BBW7_9SPHN|nr:hypothetical protein [Stakelama sp. W311]WNO54784.1 hypothetical protein RPR59_05935 [Stakelama sp. W311]
MNGRQRLLVSLAGIVALILAVPLTTALDRLSSARSDLTATRAAVATAPTGAPVARGAVRPAANLRAAQADLGGEIRDEVRHNAVLLEALRADGTTAPLAGVYFQISGEEKAVIAVADALSDPRTGRVFHWWRMEALADGQVRLRAVMVAPWRA